MAIIDRNRNLSSVTNPPLDEHEQRSSSKSSNAQSDRWARFYDDGPAFNLPILHPLELAELCSPAQPPYWRNGAWLDMAAIVNGLADRGFVISGYEPKLLVSAAEPGARGISLTNHTIHVVAAYEPYGIQAQVWVSQEERQPYGLVLINRETGRPIVPGHTTTGAGVLRTVDGFIAGCKHALAFDFDRLLAAHPRPWRVEYDWTNEVHDARGALVIKCPTATEAVGWCSAANQRP